MKIDLYTRCWNDAHMLPFLFRHYDPLVRRYVVFDDGSTDGSIDLLRRNPKVDLRAMPPYSDPDSRVLSGLAVLESCWSESRGSADWVIVTDIDEHLHHPRLEHYLAACRRCGVTMIPALGYQMVAADFPPPDAHLTDVLTSGAPSHGINHLNVFAPDAIVRTNYAPGRHTAAPEGDVIAPARDELLLLHYQYLDFERTLQRHQRANTRQRAKDVALGYGFHYAWSRDELMREWQERERRAVDVAAPDLRPWETHPGPRWWSEYPRVEVVY